MGLHNQTSEVLRQPLQRFYIVSTIKRYFASARRVDMVNLRTNGLLLTSCVHKAELKPR